MIDPSDAAQALKTLMDAVRQTNRLLRLSFPRQDGPDALMVANQLVASEGLSRDFHFSVEVLSDTPDIELKDVMGRMVTVELVRDDGSLRYFNGYVFDFRFVKNDAGFAYYDMVLLPWLAFLRYRRDNYLFHGERVQSQTEIIFSDYDVRDWETRLLGSDEPMTDACQYDETDYNYLHRRWEAKGWHYWYEHRADGHTLVLSGDSKQSDPIDGGDPGISWEGESGVTQRGIVQFSAVRTVASTQYAAASFDFKNPRPRRGDIPTLNKQGKVPRLEVYEYTGAYGLKNEADQQQFLRLRMEEVEAGGKHFKAAGDDDRAQPGRWFKLTGQRGRFALPDPKEDSDFLILEVQHVASNNYATHQGGGAEYSNTLTCLRKKIPWHPGRGFNSSEPKITGLQTALVVGPEGQEIHTDKYGRIRVQFHWDREGGYNQHSSAWVRVASLWAGSNFGAIAIPRIGQEVVVQFLDGNPDRPLVTGSLYNERQMPPWTLPANKTQTGILSRSSPGGGYENANALRFEDRKDHEEVWLHAEKDQRIEVEHDESHWVGHDRRKTIDHDETTHVKHDRTETVDHDERITVHNNRSERVDHDETISIGDNRREDVGANESISIGQNKTETVAIAKALTVGAGYAVTVGGAMNTAVGLAQSEQVGLGKSTQVGQSWNITAGDELTITVGAASLVMKSDGTVLINGTRFDFSASGPVQISGKDVDVN